VARAALFFSKIRCGKHCREKEERRFSRRRKLPRTYFPPAYDVGPMAGTWSDLRNAPPTTGPNPLGFSGGARIILEQLNSSASQTS
jgi:hypothetical protein